MNSSSYNHTCSQVLKVQVQVQVLNVQVQVQVQVLILQVQVQVTRSFNVTNGKCDFLLMIMMLDLDVFPRKRSRQSTIPPKIKPPSPINGFLRIFFAILVASGVETFSQFSAKSRDPSLSCCLKARNVQLQIRVLNHRVQVQVQVLGLQVQVRVLNYRVQVQVRQKLDSSPTQVQVQDSSPTILATILMHIPMSK